jgi:soluble lytic murein transglycosylase
MGRIRRAAAGLGVALLSVSRAQAQPPVMSAVRAQDWPAADALARQSPDPLAEKLVRYLRLLSPGQATAPEIGAFIADNPSWPQLPVLRKRLSEAVAAIADDAAARAVCEDYVPGGDTALLRCAAAEQAGGHAVQAANLARQAWVAGVTNPAAESAFLQIWGSIIDADTQWRRFNALIGTNDSAAARQVGRVDAQNRTLAAARLAFRRNDAAALDRLAAVAGAQRSDPVLLLDQARWLRGNNDTAAALALWRTEVAQAEPAAPPDRRAAFWPERDRLARLLLKAGDADGAYFIADDAHVSADQAADSLFLGGWIALRKLHDPARATLHFQSLAASSVAVITQGRAYYWLGRAAPNDAAAKVAYAKAAAFPTSYYGQLAAAKLDGQIAPRILALPEPPVVAAAVTSFDRAELVHAAVLLQDWGDANDARRFLLRDAQANPDLSTDVLTARRGLSLGLPDVAVQAARLAGRIGTALPHLGWPAPFLPPPGVDAPLALGLMRQESSFDPGVVSGAGAVGLMQLLPGTARQVDAKVNDPALLTDPATNMRVGVAYLHTLLDQFGGVQPYALAAYNAGPRHVREWIADNGDAGTANDSDAMIDWIEMIPFAETRNYVQRVLESAAIYRTYAAQ